MDEYLPPRLRKWIYGIATAALPLLVIYGILDESQLPLWAALIGAILVPGLAAVNTHPQTPVEHRPEEDDAVRPLGGTVSHGTVEEEGYVGRHRPKSGPSDPEGQ